MGSTKWSVRVGVGALAGVLSLAVATPGLAAAGRWSIDPAPASPDGNDTLNAVAAVTDADAWTVGTTFTAPDANLVSARPLALRLTAAGWQRSPLPAVTANTALFGVGAFSTNDAWAVGKATGAGYSTGKPVTVHWNGSAWSTVTPPAVGGFLAGVADLGVGNAYAVGTLGRTSPLVEHWNGTQWSQVTVPDADPAHPGGTGHLTAISAHGVNDVWAVGRFSTLDGNAIEAGGYALHFDGTAWKSTLMPGPSGANPSAVVTIGPGDAWAVVNTSPGGDAFIEHWNGTSWTIVLTEPAIEYPTLTGITGRSANDVWAVGGFLTGVTTPTQVRTTRTLHWNGTTWTVVASPTPSGGADLSGTATAGVHTWAVGTATGPFILSRTD